MSTRLLYFGIIVVWLLIVLAIGIRLQNSRESRPTPVVQRPQFQTTELTYTLNRLNQLRISWEHRQAIIPEGDKLMMQQICLKELQTEIQNIEAILERQNNGTP